MILQKQRRLVDLLLAKTREGKLEWKSALAENTFQVSFRTNTVQLSETPSSDDKT